MNAWQRWYDALPLREKIRYHIGIWDSRFGDWVVDHPNTSLVGRLSNNDRFWNVLEFFTVKLSCKFISHAWDGNGFGGRCCVYCGWDENGK